MTDPETGTRDVRWWLVTALVAATGLAVLFWRSQGPFGDDVSGLLFIEMPPAIALVVLAAPGGKRRQPVGAIIAYAGAVMMAFYTFALAAFPGGAPDTSDPLRPPPLNETQSLIGVTIATAAVMICASFYARGRARIMVNLCTLVILGAFVALKTLVFR